jgi:RNase P subunit RPR2
MPPVQPKMAAPPARNLVQAKTAAAPPVKPAPRPYSAPLAGTIVQRVNGGKKPKKPKRSHGEDDDYVPPQGKAQKRFSVPKSNTELVIRATAHKRAHYDGTKYRAVYTCPGCRRPIAYENSAGKIVLTRRDFRSKSNKVHKQRALQLDHYPIWAERERALKARGATDDEMRDEHNRVSGLRAICSMCNASHRYERRKKIEYLSDTDEEGYMTPDDEPCNKGAYKPFRFDPPPPPPGAGGITT